MGKNGLCGVKMNVAKLKMHIARLLMNVAGLQMCSASLKVSIAGPAIDYVQAILTIAKLLPVPLPLVLCRAVLF
ncbi:MAG: hypothetical protein JXR36_15910 [Bacteroidales bacterium]|nr:hypothetical protein [Bacteroidales bacterium]